MSLIFTGAQYNTITTNTGGSEFTVMARVSISSASTTSTLDIITEYGSRNSFRLFWANGQFSVAFTHVTMFLIFPTYNTASLTTSTPHSGDTWYHVALTLKNKALTLYVDGLPVGSTTFDGTAITPSSNTLGALRTGTSSYSNYFRGEIEDYRIYSTALDPEYIQIISTHKGFDEIYQSLMGRWKLIGPAGSTALLLDSINDSVQNVAPTVSIIFG